MCNNIKINKLGGGVNVKVKEVLHICFILWGYLKLSETEGYSPNKELSQQRTHLRVILIQTETSPNQEYFTRNFYIKQST